MKSPFKYFLGIVATAIVLTSSMQLMAGQFEIRIPTGKKVEAKAPALPANCLEILNAGSSVGDGIYEIDMLQDGNATQSYCDMTSDGGGWTLALHFVTTVPTRMNVDEIAVSGMPMTTWSADPGSYPVMPSGVTNNFSEQMFKGGKGSWLTQYGPWFKYPMFSLSQFPISSEGFQVTLSDGSSKTVWHRGRGWVTYNAKLGYWYDSYEHMAADPGLVADMGYTLSFWDRSGKSPNCGGNGTTGNATCINVMEVQNGGNHFDYSSAKFIFVR